jgi:EcsC family protein
VIPEADLADLRRARGLLESPGFAARAVAIVGRPIEAAFAHLPAAAHDRVQAITRKAIERALDLAVATLGDREPRSRRSHDKAHRVLTAATGALGGAFGMAGLAVELPVTTAAMLRSIADVARSEGEDLRSPEARLACLQVLALGGAPPSDDAAETGYFAVRAVFAKSVAELAEALTERGVARRTAPAFVELVARLAARYGVSVSEKLAAQAVPVVGALGGAAINVLFTAHFQSMARGHFIVRRLERAHGAEAVKQAYQALGPAPAAPLALAPTAPP